MADPACPLCAGSSFDAELGRELVWEDDLWRLTTSIGPGDPTPGFSYLEPRRHVANMAELDGPEAATFGTVLARCCRALQQATDAECVYVYVFGEHIPHLHVHLAPHTPGDALVDVPIRGELEERVLDTGHVAVVSKDFAALPQETLRSAAARVRQLLQA